MAGANIFMIYSDSTGQNITLSPRLGVGHVQPDYDNAEPHPELQRLPPVAVAIARVAQKLLDKSESMLTAS